LIELEIMTKQGEARNLELSLSKIVSQNKVIAYQGIARDCTQRVALEKQILQKNRELTAVVSVSSAVSHTLDIDETRSLVERFRVGSLSCGGSDCYFRDRFPYYSSTTFDQVRCSAEGNHF
jgi:hypothetical protein